MSYAEERVASWGWSDAAAPSCLFWGWEPEVISYGESDESVLFWGWADGISAPFWGWWVTTGVAYLYRITLACTSATSATMLKMGRITLASTSASVVSLVGAILTRCRSGEIRHAHPLQSKPHNPTGPHGAPERNTDHPHKRYRRRS